MLLTVVAKLSILDVCLVQATPLLFPCYTFSMLHFFHAALFPRCTFFIMPSFLVALFSCCTFSMLHFFHVALFSCCTFFMFHFFHVALFSCCTFLMLKNIENERDTENITKALRTCYSFILIFYSTFYL